MDHGRIADEISRLVEISGYDDVPVRATLGRGAIWPRRDDCRVRSTAIGRDEQEALLLKFHSKPAIGEADGPLPDDWRKKNCRQENHKRGNRAAALRSNLEGNPP